MARTSSVDDMLDPGLGTQRSKQLLLIAWWRLVFCSFLQLGAMGISQRKELIDTSRRTRVSGSTSGVSNWTVASES